MLSWLTALANVAKAIGMALGLIRDKQQRDAGAAAQVLVDTKAEARAAEDALQVANNLSGKSTAERLRDGDFGHPF